MNDRIVEPFAETRPITVLYATNRRPGAGGTCSDQQFTAERDRDVRYGACIISVPSAHAVGAIDETEREIEPERYFVANSHTELTAEKFYSDASSKRPTLIFVHGFNVRFREAVMRAAQIAYDAKFQGNVILFTWPAGAGENVLDSVLINRTYTQNQENAKQTVTVFQTFLEKIAESGSPPHLVVHSMGHQITLPAIAAVAKDKGRVISELILNAPDFPAEDFRAKAADLRRSARRITLYCSPGDNALKASEKMNQNQRIGSCGKVDGIDVINVNEVDAPALGIGGLGHGYYSGRPIVTDIFQVLLGMEASKRLFIRKGAEGGGENFVLRR